jgi:lysyl-tRNA synthetase class 2
LQAPEDPSNDLDWRPGADLDAVRARARMLRELRAFFDNAGVLEVETPLACRAAGTDPALEPLRTRFRGPRHPDGEALYLQTSPEFAMKRLLAAGSGAVYQVCKAFRDGEAGRLHNPEFTLLEWYRPGWGLDRLIDEVAEVARIGLAAPDLPVEQRRYRDLFRSALDIDVCTVADGVLRDRVQATGLLAEDPGVLDRDACLDLLFSHGIQAGLGQGRLTFVTDYPASQAALARLNRDDCTAARFELFHGGVELANGYRELADADEQATRFAADNRLRAARGLDSMPFDERLIAALRHGLPDCAGVALGLDRLLMLRLGVDDIDRVLAFSLARC